MSRSTSVGDKAHLSLYGCADRGWNVRTTRHDTRVGHLHLSPRCSGLYSIIILFGGRMLMPRIDGRVRYENMGGRRRRLLYPGSLRSKAMSSRWTSALHWQLARKQLLLILPSEL